MSKTAAENAQAVDAEIQEKLVDPFIAATSAALGEMASTEVMVRTVCQQATPNSSDGISAVVEITAGASGYLVLTFPPQTAAAFAGRILAGVREELDDSLIRDCVGEIANVIAGQAKAMLAGGPYQFAFAIPKVVADADASWPAAGLTCLVVAFSSDQGEFAMQLLIRL